MAEIGEIRENINAEWIIQDFFSVLKEDEDCYCSPDSIFSYEDARWYLRIKQSSDENGVKYIDLYLHKGEYDYDIIVDVYFSLKNLNGFKVLEKCCTTVEKQGHEWDFFIRFISKSELVRMKSELVPAGVLTVVCTIISPESTAGASDIEVKNEGDHCGLRPSISSQDNKILEDFKQMFLKQENCDVIIRVKGQDFPAHKIILAARSPVLASMFRIDMKEKEADTVDIEDDDPSTFLDFLAFLYYGDGGIISSKNVFSLFTAADKYNVPGLREKCMAFMKENLCLDNFCETITIALLHTESELIDLATNFFVANAENIVKTVKWQSFNAENPKQGNELFIKCMDSDRWGKP